jgi:hypothetical protein
LGEERLSVAEVVRTTLLVWRAHAVQLWLLAAIVLAPLALLELAGYHFAVKITSGKFDPATAVVNLFVILVFEIGSAEVEAVAAEKMVGNNLHGHRMPSFREFLAEVPWTTLVLATLAYEVLAVVGVLLLVVPGILVVVYLTLYGPAIVVERLGVRAAFRRSAQLVRGHFWRVFALAALVLVVGEGTGALVEWLLRDADRWVHVLAFYVVDVLLTPLQGVGIAVTYFALVALERTRDARTLDATRPAEAGPESL